MAYVKAVQSGDVIEVFTFERPPIEKRTVSRRKRPPKTLWDRQHTFRRHGDVVRAAIRFKRLVRSNLCEYGTPWLLTLTMLSVVEIDVAYRVFTDFFHRFRGYYPKIVYLSVPEFQARGAVHFHILIWGLEASILQNERNSRGIQALWGFGYVDCIPTDGSPALAGYLAKYFTKSLSDKRLAGKRAYSSGGAVVRPVSISSKTPVALDGAFEAWGLAVNSVDKPSLQYERSFDTVWLGRANYKRYLMPKTP